jgi:hypothetical protein
VTDSLDSLGRAQKAGESAQGTLRMAASDSAYLDDVGTRFAQRLRPSVCNFQFQPPSASASGFSYRLDVTGSACPMDLEYAISFENSLFEIKWTQDTHFKITDPDLAKLNDIDSFSLQGGMDASPTVDTTASVPAFQMKGTLAMNGTAHSQKYGGIKVTVDGTVNAEQSQTDQSSHSEVRLTLAYSDFSAEFKETVDSDGKSATKNYTLNGESLTEDQFQSYIQRAGNVFSQGFSSSPSR